MASPCELLVDGADESEARRLTARAAKEAWRIEAKFSRYRKGNIVYAINNAAGKATPVDGEAARLLAYAEHCWQLSDGLFDVTSGVLRRAWKFDGSNRIPSTEIVDQIRPLVGWDQVTWTGKSIQLKPNMEIDLGGIGKEYAVDRAFDIVASSTDKPVLVNFGGDLCCSGVRQNGLPWQVGVETIADPNTPHRIELHAGALATSGDARRFLLKDGVRYSHVLNPKTGWPVVDAPHSVTVAAESCSEAGLIATLALLHGNDAESFLAENELQHWCQR